MFPVRVEFFTQYCFYCNRLRKIAGNRNGWCLYCFQCYARNGAQWKWRLVCKTSRQVASRRECLSKIMDFVAGSPRLLKISHWGRDWERMLLGKCPQTMLSEDDFKNEDDYFTARAAEALCNPFWKLQFSYKQFALPDLFLPVESRNFIQYFVLQYLCP